MSKTEKTNQEPKKDLGYWTLKMFWLCFAIVLMSFAHSLFTYTRLIGMSPLTAATESISLLLGELFNINGYSIVNYIITTILIVLAITLAKKGDRWKTSTCVITGYGLAIVINIFIVYIIGLLPGLTYNSISKQGNSDGVIWAMFWYIVAYFVLVNSIGIWVSVGYGLRPYDAFLVNLGDRDRTYLFWRNTFSLIFVVIALACGIATTSLIGKWTIIDFVSNSAVGPGTLITMFMTGILTKKTIVFYSKFI